jgi:acyl-CoA synthetase (NDP forming)
MNVDLKSKPTADRTALIERCFNPESVVIVGASMTPGKWGYRVAMEAIASADQRRIYLINAKGGEILSHPVLTSVSSLPEAPELAVITVPLGHVISAVKELLALGTRAFVCITAGSRLRALGARGRTMLCGK